MFLDIEVVGEGKEEREFGCGCRLSRAFTGHLWLESRSFRIGYCCNSHPPQPHFMTQGDAVYFYSLHPASPFRAIDGLAHGRFWPERDAGCKYAFAAADHTEMMQFVRGDQAQALPKAARWERAVVVV